MFIHILIQGKDLILCLKGGDKILKSRRFISMKICAYLFVSSKISCKAYKKAPIPCSLVMNLMNEISFLYIDAKVLCLWKGEGVKPQGAKPLAIFRIFYLLTLATTLLQKPFFLLPPTLEEPFFLAAPCSNSGFFGSKFQFFLCLVLFLLLLRSWSL